MLEIDNIRRESWSWRNLMGQDKHFDWTPAPTFATAGDQNLVFSTAIGCWERQGNTVQLWASLVSSTFTHTTAAGSFRIGSIPFLCMNRAGHFPVGVAVMGGWTKANYTQLSCYASPGLGYLLLRATGSGQAAADIAAGDIPTGGSVTLYLNIQYEV